MRGDIDMIMAKAKGHMPRLTSPGTGAGRSTHRRGEVQPWTHDKRTKAILLGGGLLGWAGRCSITERRFFGRSTKNARPRITTRCGRTSAIVRAVMTPGIAALSPEAVARS